MIISEELMDYCQKQGIDIEYLPSSELVKIAEEMNMQRVKNYMENMSPENIWGR